MAALGDRDDRGVREGLHELARKELVRPARNSSMEGQQEYSFWHALVRDVSYNQIPRAQRGRRHRSVAEWLERIAGDRASDHAEVLAHHYETALELTRASSDTYEVVKLEAATSRFLVLAGERSLDLDLRRAHSYFERAVALLSPGEPQRATALAKKARTATGLGRYDEALVAYGEAIEEFQRQGDVVGAGEAMARSCVPLWFQGRTTESAARMAAAVELLETQPPGPALVYAYHRAASDALLAGRFAEGYEMSEKSLRLAAQLGDQKGIAAALLDRGFTRCEQGDLAGVDDVHDALKMALAQNMGEEASQAYGDLAELVWLVKGPRLAMENNRDGLSFVQRQGRVDYALYLTVHNLAFLFDAGEWERLVGEAEGVLEEIAHHPQYRAMALPFMALVLVLRGMTNEAVLLEREFVPLARQIGDLQVLVPALTSAAVVRASVGDGEATQRLAEEFSEATEGRTGWRARYLPELIRALVRTGHHETAKQLLVNEEDVHIPRDRHSALTAHALVAEAEGHIEQARDLYERAAQRWADYGHVLEEGQAHLGLARCLIALGDREAATEPLQKARAIFSRLGAVPLINETDTYLAQAEAAS